MFKWPDLWNRRRWGRGLLFQVEEEDFWFFWREIELTKYAEDSHFIKRLKRGCPGSCFERINLHLQSEATTHFSFLQIFIYSCCSAAARQTEVEVWHYPFGELGVDSAVGSTLSTAANSYRKVFKRKITQPSARLLHYPRRVQVKQYRHRSDSWLKLLPGKPIFQNYTHWYLRVWSLRVSTHTLGQFRVTSSQF